MFVYLVLCVVALPDDTPVRTPTKPEAEVEEIQPYTAAEERSDAVNWKMINIGDAEDFRLDMRVIEPYKRVLSHGGECPFVPWDPSPTLYRLSHPVIPKS